MKSGKKIPLEEETVWLTQKLTLFEVTVPTISEHTANLYDHEEISKMATIRNFQTVQKNIELSKIIFLRFITQMSTFHKIIKLE